MQNDKISLVVLRVELDDHISSKNSFTHIFNLYSYNPDSYKRKYTIQRYYQSQDSTIPLDLPENFTNKEEALKAFIGQRKFHNISIETFNFQDIDMSINGHSSSLSSSSSSSQEHLMSDNINNKIKLNSMNNSSTIKKALETAYDDWNKNKNKTSIMEKKDTTLIVENKDNIKIDSKVEIETTDVSEVNINSKINNNTDTNSNTQQKTSEIINEDTCTDNQTTSIINSTIDNAKIKIKSSKLKLKPNSTMITTITAASTSKLSSTSTAASSITAIQYHCGNPTVDTINGILHIYKDSALTSINDDSPRSEMICMLGVPANITCNELISFVSPHCEGMLYMRILRDTCPNQYMVLIKFKTQKEADEFYKYNNNRPFNLIEENTCHLVYVESVEVISSSKGASLPIPGFTELPNCYICLEKMDESLNGVITVLCNHSFHANCLSKWGDTNCPVCRYTQTPDFSADSVCSECGSHENLWICLICGHVGCGRYVRGHAYSHFHLTQHTYSMQIGSNRVWDYAGDNYVHRLIQNKTDGKMVQFDEAGRIINQDEKIDSITIEYTYLLQSQLESQRMFFEDKLFSQEEKAQLQIHDLETKVKTYEHENKLLNENVEILNRDKTNLEKKCSQLNAKVNKLQSSLEEEIEINKCMKSNQNTYQAKLIEMEEKFKKLDKEKTLEIEDLKSQLRDVLFYLDAQKKISELNDITNEELQDSQLVVQQQNEVAAGNSTLNDAKGRRKKKK